MLRRADPLALAAKLPDEPHWVETRWLLRSGGELRACGGEGAVVVGTHLPSGAVIGRPEAGPLREALVDVPDDLELIVQLESLDAVRRALPEWRVDPATVHVREPPARETGAAPAGVMVSAPPDPDLVSRLPEPEEIRRWAEQAEAITVRHVEGRVVSICQAIAVTETLWDVAIDTLEGHRRRGHAAACFETLAAHMATTGRQPVWAADDDNAASLRLAAKLGFRPVERLTVLMPIPAPTR
ncbi:MAG: GNAT family N-acetyltransferase [Solirubrobacterales bacterium]